MKPPDYIAAHIRRVLKDGGSAPHAAETQRFFKETIQARGWRTAELRRVGNRFRRALLAEHGPDYLLAVADQLFRGRILEEKAMAVLLLEKSASQFGCQEFRLFDMWIERVSNWAEHDGLVHGLIGPIVASRTGRVKVVLLWARSANRWRRRAAAVALIRGVRQKLFADEVARVTKILLHDSDEMVRKGLAWLLREFAKADPRHALPLLMKIREDAPRSVLRTACETLKPATKVKVLAAAAGSR